jgi:hypothetical protein
MDTSQAGDIAGETSFFGIAMTSLPSSGEKYREGPTHPRVMLDSDGQRSRAYMYSGNKTKSFKKQCAAAASERPIRMPSPVLIAIAAVANCITAATSKSAMRRPCSPVRITLLVNGRKRSMLVLYAQRNAIEMTTSVGDNDVSSPPFSYCLDTAMVTYATLHPNAAAAHTIK